MPQPVCFYRKILRTIEHAQANEAHVNTDCYGRKRRTAALCTPFDQPVFSGGHNRLY